MNLHIALERQMALLPRRKAGYLSIGVSILPEPAQKMSMIFVGIALFPDTVQLFAYS